MSKTFAEIHVTGEGFRTLEVYRLFFRAALREALAAEREYNEAVRDWYENGDGRPSSEGGQGLAFPECRHGRSLWVDYDIPCGACEMGDDSPIQNAIVRGREQWLRFVDRWEWISNAPGDLDIETRNRLYRWAVSLFPDYRASVR